MSIQTLIKDRYFQAPLRDLTGGLMAAIVALPLCLAFGIASGLGAAAGLYGAIACGFFAALLGGTPAQCSGPTGPMTVVAAGLIAANPGNPQLVYSSTLLAGILQIAMGYLKTGNLISYVPYPVISGFMSGIGLIIICIQFAPLFGLPGSGSVVSAIENLAKIPGSVNWQAAALSAASLLIIYLFPLVTKKVPSSLIALVASTWAAQFFHLQIPVIGEIPSGIPVPALPRFTFEGLHIVIQSALTLAILGSIDSLLTSLVMDKVTGQRHKSDQELIGQGTGNIAASLLGGLPGAGATMRSMVNVRSGGRTYLSGCIHALLLLAVLCGLGKIAALIPTATLAAILIQVGISIMDWRVIKGLKKSPKADAFVMLVVLALTVFVDLIIAVLVGVALASMIFVKQLTDAKVSSISNLETLEELRELTDRIPLSARKATYIYDMNGPLFFGEAKNLAAMVDQLSSAEYIILIFSNVPLIDQTGAYALESAIERWETKGIQVLLVGVQPNIRSTLEATGSMHKINKLNTFEHFDDAIRKIEQTESTKLQQENESK